MTHSSIARRKPASVIAARLLLSAALALSNSMAWAHPEGPGAVESYLHGLVEGEPSRRRSTGSSIGSTPGVTWRSSTGGWIVRRAPGGSRVTRIFISTRSPASALRPQHHCLRPRPTTPATAT